MHPRYIFSRKTGVNIRQQQHNVRIKSSLSHTLENHATVFSFQNFRVCAVFKRTDPLTNLQFACIYAAFLYEKKASARKSSRETPTRSTQKLTSFLRKFETQRRYKASFMWKRRFNVIIISRLSIAKLIPRTFTYSNIAHNVQPVSDRIPNECTSTTWVAPEAPQQKPVYLRRKSSYHL